MAMLGRPWGVGLGKLKKQADFGQVQLDEPVLYQHS